MLLLLLRSGSANVYRTVGRRGKGGTTESDKGNLKNAKKVFLLSVLGYWCFWVEFWGIWGRLVGIDGGWWRLVV